MSQASSSIAYPVVDSYPNELLTETHYDDYAGIPAGFSSGLYNSGYGAYLTASSAAPDYAEPISQSITIKGMVAWTRVKVLGTTSQFISTVNIYDVKGRLIQQQTLNVTGALDIVTNQYSFSNQLLRKHIKHQILGGTAQSYDIATKNNYDDLGRVVFVEKNINSSGWKFIASQQYDALGNLKTKKLAPSFNSGAGLETLTYDYNIRGWIIGMNRAYLRDNNASGYQQNYFGFELGYDKPGTTPGSTTFGYPQYNGNIGGTIWKSTGDEVRRYYDYLYDNANRFGRANYYQYTSPSGGGTWRIDEQNFSVHGFDADNNYYMKYDANGNILGMVEHGIKVLNTDVYIDALRYEYFATSNKLRMVHDDYSDPTTRLGDFHNGNEGYFGTDYGYDKNGNLVTDMNKYIEGATGLDVTAGGAITYNFLNLPASIAVKNRSGGPKGNIDYIYDAAGNKLKKVVHEMGKPDKTTLYLLGTYEDDVLQLLSQEEGRIRPLRDAGNNITGFTYDYFIKDHLGNVRMVLTEEQQQSIYPAATLEGSLTTGGYPNAAFTEKDYYTINSVNVVDKSEATGITDYPNNNGNPPYNNNPNSQTTANSQKLYKLEASSGGGGVSGLGITLKVMSGDKIDMFGKSYYFQNNASGSNYNLPVIEILNGLIGTPGSSAAGKGVTGTDLNGNTSIYGAVYNFLTEASRNTNGTIETPKAYINWILFDEQFKYVNGSFDRVGSNATVKSHAVYNIPVTKNGYLYVYVSNESPVKVFFDNLQVIHTRGPLLEETHYYPFGLTMAGISSKAMGKLENDKKYNGIEFENDLGIDIYDAQLRELDPQIGRWWQIDPEIESMEAWSPYASNYDNPIRFSDPLGDEPEGCCKELWNGIKQFGKDLYNTALYDVKLVNEYINPVTPIVELATGKSFESDFTEDKPRSSSATEVAISLIPGGKIEGAILKAGEKAFAKEGAEQVVKTVEKKASAGVEKKAASTTDFVVTEKGTAIPVPNRAKGPSVPNKGSGMSYQGGSGGKGMDKRVTGVRIMDANKNQGRRVNYMNKEGQTVNPKTGRTIKPNDPNSHIPIQ